MDELGKGTLNYLQIRIQKISSYYFSESNKSKNWGNEVCMRFKAACFVAVF